MAAILLRHVAFTVWVTSASCSLLCPGAFAYAAQATRDSVTVAATAEVDAIESDATAFLPGPTTVHGMAMLGFKQTFTERGSFETLLLQVEVDHHREAWGIYALPRLRIGDFDKLIEGSTVWLHQAYVYSKQPWGEVKLGKVVTAFGRIWGYGFYAPLLANNDVKLAPDLGITVAAQTAIAEPWTVATTLQYAPIDGRAIAVGHGQPLRLNSRRQQILTLRVAPTWQSTPTTHAALGLSGQRFAAVQRNDHQVLRAAVDVEGAFRALDVFAEVGLQHGDDHVVQQDTLIHSHRYVWTGAQYAWGPIAMHYHFNAIAYADEAQMTEILHQPGIAVSAGEFCTFIAEMAFWQTSRPWVGRGEKTVYLMAGGFF